MCQLTGYLASKCEHIVRYDYAKCAEEQAFSNKPCLELVHTVAPLVVDHSRPFCNSCFEDIQEEMTAEFREERRLMTSIARARKSVTHDQICQMRIGLRDKFYERMRYTNKQLPPLPAPTSKASSLSSGKNPITSGSKGVESTRYRASFKDQTYKELEKVWLPLPDSPLLRDSSYRYDRYL